MFLRQPQEGSRPLSTFPLIVTSFILLPLILISSPNSLLASAAPLDTPKLLSLLVPWAEKPAGPGVGALEALGEAPYLTSPEDERRLQAFLDSDRGDSLASGPAEWESPKNPDLFLLTEVGGAAEEEGERRRRRGVTQDTEMDDELAEVAHRMKRNGGFSVGGSRIRTSIGGGVMGAGGARGGFGSFGNGRGGGGAPIGGRMNEGPSLSIVNPLDVLRQRLLLEIARRRMRESEDQILVNREILKSIGKREVPGTEERNAGETVEKANEHKTPIQNPASM